MRPDVTPLTNLHAPDRSTVRRSLHFLTWAWIFGAVWLTATSGAPLTLFAQGLGASKFQFGLLAAMPFLASLVSMPASLLIDRTGERKRIFFWGLYGQRLAWIPIAIVPWLMIQQEGTLAHRLAIIVFLVLVFLMFCGQSVGGPAWVSWMADLVPDRSRGKYFGRRRSWGMLSAIPTAIAVGVILDEIPTKNGPMPILFCCGLIFIAAAMFGLMDVALHHPIPDIPVAPVRHHSLFEGFAKPLRDPQFLRFAAFVGTLTFSVSFIGQFVTLYVIEKLNITNLKTQLMLIAAPSLAQLLVLSGWGHAVDRMGKKPVLALASLGMVPVALGWCFMNSGATWLGYLLASAGAALWCGVEVANLNMVLEMAGSDDEQGGSRSSYVAVNSVIVNIAGCLGGITAGLIAQSLRNWTYDIGILGLAPIGFYEVLFALCALMRLIAAVVFLPLIHEPKAKSAGVVLRFMTGNIYNNLFNAVALPFRVVRAKAEISGQGTEEI